MNKSEFIATVAEKAQMTKAAAARAVDAIFDTASGAISEAVNTAGHLSIPGFGKFSTRKRAARKGRNPRTGAEIDIPERTSVAFSPGKGLKESVAGGGGGTKAKGGKAAGTGARAGGSRTASAARGAGTKGKAATGKTATGKAATGKATTRKGAGGGGTRKK